MSGLQNFLAPFSHLLFANRNIVIVLLCAGLFWVALDALIHRWRAARLETDLSTARSGASTTTGRRYVTGPAVEETPAESGALPPVKGGRTYARNLGSALHKAGMSGPQIYSPPTPAGWAPNANPMQPGPQQPGMAPPYATPNVPWTTPGQQQPPAPWAYPAGAGRGIPGQPPPPAPAAPPAAQPAAPVFEPAGMPKPVEAESLPLQFAPTPEAAEAEPAVVAEEPAEGAILEADQNAVASQSETAEPEAKVEPEREPEPKAEPRRSMRSMLFGEEPSPSPASQPQEPEPAGVGPESEPESTASSWPSYPWARDQGSTSTESGSTSAGDDAAVEPAPEPVNEPASTTSFDPWK